jgi:hypothetical protein
MNQAIRNILLEYLASTEPSTTTIRRASNTGNNNSGVGRRGNGAINHVFHERQMEGRILETVSDMIYYYNRNFTDYQENIGQLASILEEIQRARNPFYYLQTADVSLNPLFRNGGGVQVPPSVPPTQTFAQGPDLNGWDTIFRYYATPQIARTPISENRHFRSYLTNEEIQNATRPLVYSLSGEPFFDIRCPITLEDFREGDELCQIIGCGHVFKSSSLRGWFGRNTRCPVCRYNIMEHLHDLSWNRRMHLDGRLTTAGHEEVEDVTMDGSANHPITTLNEYAQLFNMEMNNNEGIQQIASIFNDFLTNPAPNRTYSIDSSNNGSSYRFDFTLF